MNYNPSTREKIQILANNFETFGFWRTLGQAVAYLLARPKDDFDQKYGVSTAGSFPPSDSEISDQFTFDNVLGYEPNHEAVIRLVLRQVSAHFNPHNLSFIDLGSGRGRVLLMAAELPFIEVIGVEIERPHCELAKKNLLAYEEARKRPAGATNGHALPELRSPIRICCADATQFDFPNTDLFVYMYNPFLGPVFRAMLDRLAEFQKATRRQVHVALCFPHAKTEHWLRMHPAFVKRHECQVITPAYSWNLWQCRSVPLEAAHDRVVPVAVGPRVA